MTKHRMVMFFVAMIEVIGVVVTAGFIFRSVQMTVSPAQAVQVGVVLPTETRTPTLTATPKPTVTSTPSPTPSLTVTLPPYVSSTSPAKQTFIAFSTLQAATEAGIPTVAKTPQPPDLNASCATFVATTGIEPIPTIAPMAFPVFGPFQGGFNLVNQAIVRASTGEYYHIWAGAPDDEPTQGLIYVNQIQPDFCAAVNRGTPLPELQSYLIPGGPLRLMKIEGDEVIFRRADGSMGRLNYVTGAWAK